MIIIHSLFEFWTFYLIELIFPSLFLIFLINLTYSSGFSYYQLSNDCLTCCFQPTFPSRILILYLTHLNVFIYITPCPKGSWYFSHLFFTFQIWFTKFLSINCVTSQQSTWERNLICLSIFFLIFSLHLAFPFSGLAFSSKFTYLEV